MRTTQKAISYCYDNGKPFSSPLDRDIHMLMDRVARKKPSILVLTGGQGEGKTTLATHIADEANSYHLDLKEQKLTGYKPRPINFKEQLAMGGKDFKKKLQSCFVNGHHVVIYDEAGDYTAIGFATRFNRMMNQVFNMNRAFSALIIVILPELIELSPKIVRATRGHIRVRDRGKNQSEFDAYDYQTTRFLVRYMKDRVIEEDAYRGVWPEYRGHFLNLPPEREAELDAYCTSGKHDIFHLQEIKEDGLISLQELQEATGWSRQQVYLKLRENHFTHAKIYKKRKYYSDFVYKKLMSEVKNNG